MEIACATCRSSLTASEAISLAELALKAGRMRTAACYINVAYAIYDAHSRSATIASALRRQDLS